MMHPTDRWNATAARRGAETMAHRHVEAQRRAVLQAALEAFAPAHPALYQDTSALMQALATVLANELAQGDPDGTL